MPSPKKYGSAAERQAAYRQRCKAKRQVELALKGIPALPHLPSMPGNRRWDAMRIQALCLVEQVANEMEVYYAQRSESWQESERGEAFAEVMESIAEIACALREVPTL